MNAIGASLTLLFSLIVLAAPRRWAVFGVFGGVCYITQGQLLDLGGFHFTAIRIILLASIFRVLARGELRSFQMNSIDWAFIGFTVVSTIIPGIRTGNWQEPIGGAYNLFLSYFAFRALVTDWKDVEELMASLALFIIPLALCMALESKTGHNVFDSMGGHDGESMREGRYRCVGAFRGPHTAGTFGATLMPMFVGLFFISPRRRPVAVAGLIAATLITYTANASGPLMAYLSALVGLAFWRLRMNMKRVRWGIVAALVVYSLLSKAPIWYIMSKVSDITGGDGWYRSYLMEQCWKHMSDWWLMGTNDTSGWGATLMSSGGADLCNLYVSCAAGIGMVGLVLIILLFVLCFRYLGLALAVARASVPEAEATIWCLGVALFAHMMTLFSVTYFDQLHVVWWGLLGIITSTTSGLVQKAKRAVDQIQPADAAGIGGEEGITHPV